MGGAGREGEDDGVDHREEKRESRRRNVVKRELKVREGKRIEEVERVLEKMGVKAVVEKVRKMGSGGEEEGEMVHQVVKVVKEEQKNEIMRKKSMLKGEKERISEDWTWKERKMRWRLEEIARKKEREENRVRIKGMARLG